MLGAWPGLFTCRLEKAALKPISKVLLPTAIGIWGRSNSVRRKGNMGGKDVGSNNGP